MLTAVVRMAQPITAALGKPQSQENTAWQEIASLVGGQEHPKNVLMADISAANALTGETSDTVHKAVEELLAQHRSTVPEAAGLSEFPAEQYRVAGDALREVAAAIAQKSGTAAPVWPEGFAEAVAGLSTGEEMAELLLSPDTTSITNHTLTALRANAFRAHPALQHAVFSKVEITGSGPFADSRQLLSVEMPRVTNLNSAPFQNCYNLERVYLPKLAGLGQMCFQDCSKLTRLDLPSVASMTYSNHFANCTSLVTLIFRHSALVPLPGVSSFKNTPIAGGTGYVYVPAALVDSYKAATNWVTFADQIRAIEDHPEVCGEVTA